MQNAPEFLERGGVFHNFMFDKQFYLEQFSFVFQEYGEFLQLLISLSETTQPTHDVRTTLLRRRFNVLTSLHTRSIQRRSNVMCLLGKQEK